MEEKIIAILRFQPVNNGMKKKKGGGEEGKSAKERE